MLVTNKKGFSLLEAVIAVAIFGLFVIGIYGGIQMVFKIVYQSRVRIVETALLNEEIETVRNLSFYDVGIVNGSPAGLLEYSATTTRNGMDFIITRTVRNIDDPYDGTIDGTPQDTAPADYKLVDISVQCSNCQQESALSMRTYVAPKFLEGDPTHGALFIEVFDANADPVQGASVRIVSTSTDPTYDFTDTTDNDGMLRIVDLAEGIGQYSITVTKDGYTTDATMFPTAEVLNPTKPPASVVAQDVTEISFSIDQVSQFDISTINSLCSVVGSVPFTIRGTKLLGTEPDVYLVDDSYTTDASGSYTLSDMRWDSYGFLVSGYDLIGTIPDVPFSLNPNTTQPIQLVIGTNTANSLLVMVTDNGQPVPSANVTVTSTSFSTSDLSGVGSVVQTDWSGGSGQDMFTDETRFSSSFGVDVLSNPGDVTLIDLGSSYTASGEVESSIIDLGITPSYVSLEWSSLAQPAETGSDSVRFQIATSASSTAGTWDYLGPDGTSATYYTSDSQVIAAVHDGDQYVRYKLYLQTADTDYTPTISDVSLTYTNSCTPPGQAYFGGLSADTYTVTISATGYQPYTTDVAVDGDSVLTVELNSL